MDAPVTAVCDGPRCPGIDEETALLTRKGNQMLCAWCWMDDGRPAAPTSTPQEAEAARQAIEKRMMARKGPDLHRVRSGKT